MNKFHKGDEIFNILGEHLDGYGEDNGGVLLGGDGGEGLQVPGPPHAHVHVTPRPT